MPCAVWPNTPNSPTPPSSWNRDDRRVKVTFGDGKLFVGEVIYPTIFVAVALSSFFVGRVYRKHMERKLGRRLRNEYELTSLNSWMEVSKKDEPPRD
jgi:hypothetical protein